MGATGATRKRGAEIGIFPRLKSSAVGERYTYHERIARYLFQRPGETPAYSARSGSDLSAGISRTSWWEAGFETESGRREEATITKSATLRYFMSEARLIEYLRM